MSPSRDDGGPPDDDCCPICFGDYSVPCKTSCGHWFCASCILMFWNYSRCVLRRCKCPICTRLINKFTPKASLLLQQDNEINKTLKEVWNYNNRFGGGVRGLLMKGQDLVSVIRKLAKGLSSVIRRFAEELPSVIRRFAEELPSVIRRFAEELPSVIRRFAEELPSVIRRFAEELPSVIRRFAEELPSVIRRFAEELPSVIRRFAEELPSVIRRFAEELPSVIRRFAEELPSVIRRFAEGLPDPNRATYNITVIRMISMFLGILYDCCGFDFIPTGNWDIVSLFDCVASFSAMSVYLVIDFHHRRRARPAAENHQD